MKCHGYLDGKRCHAWYLGEGLGRRLGGLVVHGLYLRTQNTPRLQKRGATRARRCILHGGGALSCNRGNPLLKSRLEKHHSPCFAPVVSRQSHFARGIEAWEPLVPSGGGTTRAEYAQGTPAQSNISPSIVVYEGNCLNEIQGQSFQ
jgi:hypothetical protein